MLCGGGHGELEQGPAATTTPDWDILKDGYIMKRAAAGSSLLDWEEEEEEEEGERDSSSLEDSHSSSDCLYDLEDTICHS